MLEYEIVVFVDVISISTTTLVNRYDIHSWYFHRIVAWCFNLLRMPYFHEFMHRKERHQLIASSQPFQLLCLAKLGRCHTKPQLTSLRDIAMTMKYCFKSTSKTFHPTSTATSNNTPWVDNDQRTWEAHSYVLIDEIII